MGSLLIAQSSQRRSSRAPLEWSRYGMRFDYITSIHKFVFISKGVPNKTLYI